MPNAQLVNPAGVDGLNASVGGITIAAVNGDSVALVAGELVEIVTPYAGATSPGYTTNRPPFQVKRTLASSQLAGLILGVVAGVYPNAGSNYPVGAVLEVVVEGPTLITIDDNGGGTTIGDAIIPSVITAGQGSDSGSATPTLGKTIATALQTVTIASGSASVWCYVHRV